MRNLEFTGDFYGEKITIKQVQKRTAKKLYESGETIFLQACNMQPFGVWSQCIDIKKDIDPFGVWSQCIDIKKDDSTDTFESIVNSFEYYNCSNETGLYTTFYKRI